MMYQPALRPEQIKALYYLKLQRQQPMTVLVREAVDDYLAVYGGTRGLIPGDEARSGEEVISDQRGS